MNEEQFLSSMLGLAVGDAMGAPIEFVYKPVRHKLNKHEFMIGMVSNVVSMTANESRQMEPGTWTDDTAQALCLAQSLIASDGKHNPREEMRNYSRWLKDGFMSCDGVAIGSGRTVREAVGAFLKEEFDYFQGTEGMAGKVGNGSIMRLAPVVISYFCRGRKMEEMLHAARGTSLVTHPSPVCSDVVAAMATVLWRTFSGLDKQEILAPGGFAYESEIGRVLSQRDWNRITFKNRSDYVITNVSINPTGFAPKSFEAALWCFAITDNFVDGMILAINIGADTDSTGAIYGQIAGGYYGFDQIPSKWLDSLKKRDLIEGISKTLSSK
jgi:ADP-ribosylglycohydrolase